MKELRNEVLLAMQLMIDGVPKSHLGHFRISEEAQQFLDDDNKFRYSVDGNDRSIGYKAVTKEIERRKLRHILPVIPHPIKLFVERIEVKGEAKSGSNLSLPDSVTKKMENMEMLKEHPLQATVVSIGRDVEFPALGIGSRIYLNTPPPHAIVYKEGLYYEIPVHLIACLVFK